MASSTPTPDVQRQIVLPMSKAAEIAYKSIRLRLSRSLLVTSGIVLALAFLMSIQVNEAMIGGMREWIRAGKDPAHRPAEFTTLEKQKTALDAQIDGLKQQLAKPSSPEVTPPIQFDMKHEFDMEWQDFQRQAGGLPLQSSDVLKTNLASHPDLVPVLHQWFDARLKDKVLVEQLNGPQFLEAMMRDSGVPTTEKEIAAARTQTYWLLGLALLVAFVGILNAMLMSVTERFREIGTMKCLGALDSFIIKLFLIESLLQGIVGTTVGVSVGLLLSLLTTWSKYGSFAWKNVPVSSLAISAAWSFVIGVILTVGGALYPAWQAARMQPIEAMRAET